MTLAFSTETNNYFTKIMAQSFAYSDPNLKSKEDWLAFVDEVDKHLKRYAIGGIFPEQYEGVLQPHFTLMIWTYIFEDHVPRAPNLISRPEEWRPVLDLYSLKYYNCEVKIRSNNKFLHDTAEYSQSGASFRKRFTILDAKRFYSNYFDLLIITHYV